MLSVLPARKFNSESHPEVPNQLHSIHDELCSSVKPSLTCPSIESNDLGRITELLFILPDAVKNR
jgi:hypothetical protein